MKNEEVKEIIEGAVEKAPLSGRLISGRLISGRLISGRLIPERCVWFAIREAFNRGFERGEKRGREAVSTKQME